VWGKRSDRVTQEILGHPVGVRDANGGWPSVGWGGLRRADVHGTLAASTGVGLLLIRDHLVFVEVVVDAVDYAGGVEENFLAILAADESEASVTDKTDDGSSRHSGVLSGGCTGSGGATGIRKDRQRLADGQVGAPHGALLIWRQSTGPRTRCRVP